MFDLVPNLIASVVAVLFPIFASYKALRTSDPAQLSPWLMYWVSFALFTLFETYTYFVLGWVPGYGLLRLVLLLYLVLPQTQGARVVYQNYVNPFLADHEKRIEDFISSTHDQLKAAGLDYINQLIEFVRKNVFGMRGEPPKAPAPVGSYAQSLLARFDLPSARDGLAAPAGDFYGLLSAAAGALGRNTSTSREAQIDELSRSGSLVPSHIGTNLEKARFLNAQREKLKVLLSALDKEASTLGVEDRRPVSSAGLQKSKSEVSFDRIESDEASEEEDKSPDEAGRWFGWAFEQVTKNVGVSRSSPE